MIRLAMWTRRRIGFAQQAWWPAFLLMGMLLVLGVFGWAGPSQSQSAFVYQGRLLENGQPAQGSFDLRFIVFDQQTAGVEQALPEEVFGVMVRDGYFSTRLSFGGALQMTGEFWVELELRPAGTGEFTALAPRNALLPAPRVALAQKIGVGGVNSQSILDRSLKQEDLQTGSVREAQLQPNSIGNSELADGSVDSSALQTAAVGADQIGSAAVGSEQLFNQTVGPDEIAENAVDAAAIAAGAVGSEAIALGAVGASELATDAVGNSEIAAASITASKIAAGAVGAFHVDRNEIQLRVNESCVAGGRIREISQLGNVVCETDSQGIADFGSPISFFISSTLGSGARSLNIGNLSERLCTLSSVQKTDVDGTNEVAKCELLNLGTWVLRATATGDATVFCRATCLPYIRFE